MSLPSWERGLKFFINPLINSSATVAPLVGAWIEITYQGENTNQEIVAPLVGAWIEISDLFGLFSPPQSRSPRGSVD